MLTGGRTSSFHAFLGISTLLIATPNPDTAITIRSTLAGGHIGEIAIIVGIAVGQTMW